MSIFDNNNLVEITQDDLRDAIQSSSHFDIDIQKRAFANVLGARLGIKFLSILDTKADNHNSMYTIPAVLKDLDISDIRTTNNLCIDVRIVADESHLCIPKAQYEFNIIPDIYIFIKLSPDLSSAAYIGAIAPDEIDKSVEDRNYYFISVDTLYNESSLKQVLLKGKPQSNVQPNQNDIIKAESLLVNFIDGDLLNSEKTYFYDILKQSNELKEMFRSFEQFEMISTDLAHTEEILNDSVLDVLGAQAIYKNDLSDSDISLNVDLDELSVETASDFVEEFIDENREYEMNDNNDIIEGEFEELSDDTPNEDIGQLEELPSDEELANFSSFDENTLLQDDNDLADTQSDLEVGFEGFEGLGSESSNISLDEFGFELNNTADESNDVDLTEQLDVLSDNTNFEFTDNLETSQVELTPLDDVQADDTLNNNEELLSIDIEQNTDTVEDFLALDTTQNTEEELYNTETNNDFSFDNINIEKESVDNELSEADQFLTSDNFTGFDDNTNANELVLEAPTQDLLPMDIEPKDNTSDEFDNSPIESDNTISVDNNQIIEETDLSSDLEVLTQPIDMELPTLSPDENLDLMYKANSGEESSDETLDIEAPQTLDDISTSIDFSELNNSDTEQLAAQNFDEINNSEFSATYENIEPINQAEDLNTSNLAESKLEDSATENDDGDMSGLEEFTLDMAEAYEKANPQAFANTYQQSQPQSEMPAYNEADFSMTSPIELPALDELPALEPLTMDNNTEISNEVPTNNTTELDKQEESVEFIPDTDTSYTDNGFNSELGMDIQADSNNSFNINPSEDPSEYQNITDNQGYDYNSNYTEMEVYRPEELAEPQPLEIPDNNVDNDLSSVSFDDLKNDNASTQSSISDINLDELDSDDEFGDLNILEDNGYTDASGADFDINEINIDEIDINDPNLNIENLDIDMSEFDVSDMDAGNNTSDTPMPEQNMPQQENIPNEAEYTPDFQQNDASTINELYEQHMANQNPGDVINESFNQNEVNSQPQTKQKGGKKKSSPLLGILIIVLVCAFGYIKKDLIMEKINSNKSANAVQDQNMPVEGETQEEIEDAKLLNEEGEASEGEQNTSQENQEVGEMPGEAGGPQDAASMEQSIHQQGSQANEIPKDSVVNKTPEPLNSSRIKRIYWEIPQDLSYNDSIVNYLKTAGRTMKFAMQSDLLNTTEMPYSSKMIVDVQIKKDGSVEQPNITVSSGSKQIDEVVLQSVKAALKYVKAPTAEFKNDSYNFSIIINF